MKTSNQFQQKITALILKQKNVILWSVIICSVVSMISYRFSTKRYKVNAVVNISTQYFQVPLVRDLLAETYDGQELRAQRESLIKRAINHKFLKEIGNQYSLFPKEKTALITTYDLDLLSKKFEIIPIGPSSFLIGLFHSDPQIGFNILQDTIKHIKNMLYNERQERLMNVLSSLRERLEVLSFGEQKGSPSTLLASRPDLVQQEIKRIEDEIKILTQSYSEAHPKVTKLSEKRDELSKWMLSQPESQVPTLSIRNFSGDKVDAASKDLFQDLLKKYHYLEIMISLDRQNENSYLKVVEEPYVPQTAVWPKRPIFLVWGIAIGFIIGMFIILFQELVRLRKDKSIDDIIPQGASNSQVS